MLKVRYFRVRLPTSLSTCIEVAGRLTNLPRSAITLLSDSSSELIVKYRSVRQITTYEILDDGAEVRRSVPTMDLHSIRLFPLRDIFLLSILDPPRGSKAVSEFLDLIVPNGGYFFEPLEITTAMVEKHVRSFDSARLVSAKIRDFQVYEGAVGRLEITSKAGLRPGIAPFIGDKFHRIDSLTYEVTSKFTQGLVNYASNGTIRASGPLVELAFPAFEAAL